MSAKLSADFRQAVVTDLATLAREKYINPTLGEQISQALLTKYSSGAYDTLTDPHVFALALKSDLRTISNDKHWDVFYEAKQATVSFGDLKDEENAAETARWLEQSRRKNFGFEKVERLTGNIGYIDLRGFPLPEYAGETAVAAMAFVANCDALIFDLRKNGGGEAEMVQLLISYLFSPELKHLNTIYSRPADEHWQFWTLPYVPGKRMPEIPVYVLTSRATFSAAEEFAYDLKHMGRATLIGEPTGGGAHMVDLAVIQENFQVLFPFAGAIHPITKTNWEGTGVEPHIQVPQEQALQTAHLHTLRHLLDACKSEQKKKDLVWDFDIVSNHYAQTTVEDVSLARLAGQYGQRTFAVADGTLTYATPQSIVFKLIPMSATRFRLNEDIKFEFTLDMQDKAVAVIMSYRDDRPEIRIEKEKEK